MEESRRAPESREIIGWAELIASIAMSCVAVFLHLRFFLHAGPLWRDEISSLSLATAPTANEFWRCFGTDVFPPLYFLVLRSWDAIGFGSTDLALRGLGLLIGIEFTAAIWFAGRSIDRSPPLWPLALLALTPLTLEYADQLRPYGLAGIFMMLTIGAVWKLASAERLTSRLILATGVLAVLSVQTSYSNSLLLFAICVGGITVAIRRGSMRAACVILGIGAIAAGSIVPYFLTFHASHDWMVLLPGSGKISEVVSALVGAISLSHRATSYAWAVLAMVGCATAFIAPLRNRMVRIRDDRLIFAGVTLIIATAATLTFFRVVNWLSYPRYFFLLVCVAAICLHVFARIARERITLRVANLITSLAFAAVQIPNSYFDTGVRLTNCDRAAAAVAERAGPNDVIVLTTFYYGINFQRYYRGSAYWTALPPIGDYRLHRWDLAKQAMSQPAPIRDVLERMEVALRSGHKVYLVGRLANRPPPAPVQPLPPAPQTSVGWQLSPYLANWQAQVGYFVEQHGTAGESIPLETGQPIAEFEEVGVFVISGWRTSERE